MSDEADRAQPIMEAMEQENLHKSRRPEGPASTGLCLHCDEPLAEGRRWCDAEHRDLWERGLR